MFEPGRTVKVEDVTDGTSNTLLVVEATRPVPWTKPEDLVYVPEDINAETQAPLPAIGSRHRGGSNAAFADSAARFLKTSINPTILRALMTRDGGEVTSRG
jgi:prepilin-type processing-associated H-X9-DG protein